jgi:hypothetical protein
MSDASVSFGLDAKEFDERLAAIEAKVATASRSMSRSFGGISLGALGGGLSLSGVVAGLKSLSDYGAKIQDLSNQTGVSTDTLQHFGNAAEKNGSSLDAMGQAFRKLELARSKALGGNEELAASFLQLGVGIQDLTKLDPEQIMLKIGKSSLNAADAVKVFGKNALELRPILAGISDGTIKMGEAIDKNVIAKLKQADDSFKNVGQQSRVYGSKVIEGIESVSESIGREYESIENLSKNVWQKAGSYFTNLFHGKIKAGIKDVKELGNILVTPDILDAKAGAKAKQIAGKPGAGPRKFDEEDDLKQQTLEAIKERSKLSLGELASRDAYGESAFYRGRYIGGDISQAQEAEREKGLAEDAAVGGRDDEAKQHMGRFQQLTSGIGSLRDKDKGLGGLADNVQSIEKSAQQIAKNTGQPFVNH